MISNTKKSGKNMKNQKGKIFILISLLLLNNLILAGGKTPFTMNGWQFHEYNIPKLEEAISKAKSYGVNFFIFSHNLFRSVEGFLVSDENLNPNQKFPHLSKLYASADNHTKPHPNWQKDLKYVASLADKQKIPFYLWIHEFDDIPDKYKVDGKVNYDNPDLFSYIKERYEKLLSIMPNAAGFVLTFHESHNKIFRNTEVISQLDVPERIYRLTKLIYDVVKARNKKLILRSFLYEPKEMEYFKSALSKLPNDLIVMSKTTFHEFAPFYPPDSMHGDVGEKQQIIEIDLGVEKAWSSKGAYAQTEYIQRYVRRALDKNLAGMVGRCRIFWDEPFKNSHEVNLYAFSKFMQDPSLSVDQVLIDWANRRYPYAPNAAPYIASALARTQFINHNGRYHLGVWLTKSIGSEWGDYRYYFGHISQRSRYKWTLDPSDKELENKIHYPNEDTFYKLVAEKDEVINQVKASMADLKHAEKYLKYEDMEELNEDFRFLLDASLLQKEWVRAFFAQRLFMQQPDNKYLDILNDALEKLQAIEKTPGVIYGLDSISGRRYNIDQFVLEMQWRVANRSRALDEDKRILQSVKEKVNVQAN